MNIKFVYFELKSWDWQLGTFFNLVGSHHEKHIQDEITDECLGRKLLKSPRGDLKKSPGYATGLQCPPSKIILTIGTGNNANANN